MPAMKLYRAIIAKYGAGANAERLHRSYGVAKAETFVQVLYKAGKNPTRAGLMNALLSMNYDEPFAASWHGPEDVARPTASSSARCSSSGSTQRHVCGRRSGRLVEGRPR